MSAFQCPTNQQARLNLAPTSVSGGAVKLDPDALTVTSDGLGGGTFEYNPTTNGLVFRPADVPEIDDNTGATIQTHYHVDVDGQPGPGKTFLPLDYDMEAIAENAVSAGDSISFEAKGTPA